MARSDFRLALVTHLNEGIYRSDRDAYAEPGPIFPLTKRGLFAAARALSERVKDTELSFGNIGMGGSCIVLLRRGRVVCDVTNVVRDCVELIGTQERPDRPAYCEAYAAPFLADPLACIAARRKFETEEDELLRQQFAAEDAERDALAEAHL